MLGKHCATKQYRQPNNIPALRHLQILWDHLWSTAFYPIITGLYIFICVPQTVNQMNIFFLSAVGLQPLPLLCC